MAVPVGAEVNHNRREWPADLARNPPRVRRLTGGQNNTETRSDQGSTGGLLTGSQSTSTITELLQTDASSYTWVAAAIGSNTAAGYQLAAQLPVMAIGGFDGSDPSPTLTQLTTSPTVRSTTSSRGGSGNGGGPGA